jgi:maltose/maltodextrin transport system permease protein
MLSRVVTAVAAILALFIVYQLYVGGNPLLAVAVAGGLGLAFFVYTARGTYTYRYLFPGLAGIALFIVLPLVYTVWLGFTNYSSRNLLTYERATDVLLGELVESDAHYQFTLHADGSGFRIVLRTGDEEPAAASTESGIILDDNAGSGSNTGSGAGSARSAGRGSADDIGSAGGAPADAGSAAPSAPARPPPPTVFVTQVLPLTGTADQRVPARPLAESGFTPGDPLPLRDVIARRDAIRATTVQFPDGSSATMASLREFTPQQPLYRRNTDGSLTNQKTGEKLTPNLHSGYYETPGGGRVLPGFRAYVGFDNYTRAFTDEKFRGPFFRVFLWTIVFAALTVVACTSLGLLLAELLNWDGLRFAGLYRVLLFLPYAVPGFISILVFKGLFNRNFGEINLILDALLGIRPNWTGNAFLARFMILIVNTWLGYPYFMLIGMGLQKAIPRDLYEASALAGAGPWTNFSRITWPLIRKPLMPLMVSAFAFNFNNFVLIFLLTAGRPDFLDTSVPSGETDILVSYTYRIAFEDSGQNFGLAAAISTLIFVMVAVMSVINLRLTRANAEERR